MHVAPLAPAAAAVVRYALVQDAMQRRVIAAVAHLAPVVAVVPAVRGLDQEGRLDALALLGARLSGALSAARAFRSASTSARLKTDLIGSPPR